MGLHLRRRSVIAGAAALSVARPLRAEVQTIRASHGYSIGYLPLMVMREQSLLEKHAASAGLGRVTVEWQIQDGGNNINDAMLARALDIAGTGIPGYLVLRDRTLGRWTEVTSIAALDSGALWLNTIDPRIKSLADYGPGDRIAVPGIKTSYAAAVLEMVTAKQFGMANYAKLDPCTVGMAHPDAYAAIMSGGTEIKSHMASPPFSYQELKNPAVHRVLSTAEVLGPLTILLTMTTVQFAKENPGLTAAFLAAQEEACAFITADKSGAAAAYVRASGIRTPQAELMDMLNDPENEFSVVPRGAQTYADFLLNAGVIRTKSAGWRDLFLPELRDRAGS